MPEAGVELGGREIATFTDLEVRHAHTNVGEDSKSIRI